TAYFTAVADEQGKIATFPDIYKLDPPVAAAIIGKQAKPEAVADNIETGATPTPTPKPKPGPKPSASASAPSSGFGPSP
ncbi:MAG: hypothetical protein WBW51_13870, partial [Methyloceanibacter sp.]